MANVDSCLDLLREMFEKILDISKLETGVIEPQIEDFPISRLLDRLQREFGGLASEKGIDFRTIGSTVHVRSDSALLYRILGNLVCNSIRHTKDSRVLLGCRRKKNVIRIEVWDSSGGISEQDISHVFEEFYRAHTASSDRQEDLRLGLGLGLGLSIVEHTAKLLKHPLTLSSKPGRYTVFSIEVPVGESGKAAFDACHRLDSNPEVAGAAVLVVDDNAMALESLKSTLENWGCKVSAAESTRDALRILSQRTCTFDVLITDYLLDNQQTGVELIREAERILGRSPPSIVLSGVASRLIEQEAQRHGYGLLYKPVPVARLRRTLAACLSNCSNRRHSA